MHVVNGHDETLTVKLPDGKVYRITMIDGSAHVPEHVGHYHLQWLRYAGQRTQSETRMGENVGRLG
jgi:hypothetical protein